MSVNISDRSKFSSAALSIFTEGSWTTILQSFLVVSRNFLTNIPFPIPYIMSFASRSHPVSKVRYHRSSTSSLLYKLSNRIILLPFWTHMTFFPDTSVVPTTISFSSSNRVNSSSGNSRYLITSGNLSLMASIFLS